MLMEEVEKAAQENNIIGIILSSGDEANKTSLSDKEITGENIIEEIKNIKNYKNHPYEFAPHRPQPPALPEANPVGLYRTTFTAPLELRDRDVYLHIGGAKSGVYVYLNGHKVGYTEDSKTAAEFKLNDYLTDGTNVLALEIYRWSTGSYLECQDFWRISGIERDVYIYSQPSTHIEDFYVVSTLDSTYSNGLLNLDIAMTNRFVNRSGPVEVWFELEDAAGDLVTIRTPRSTWRDMGGTRCGLCGRPGMRLSIGIFDAGAQRIRTSTT